LGPALRHGSPASRAIEMGAMTVRSTSRRGESYDFRGIREYTSGDDTRRVHWPTSARLGRLMIQEFLETGPQHWVLLFDNTQPAECGPGGCTPLDLATRIGASLCRYADSVGAAITMVALGDDIALRTSSGSSQRRCLQALEWLARLKMRDAERLENWIGSLSSYVPRQACAFLLTSRATFSPDALDALESLGSSSFLEVLIFQARISMGGPTIGAYQAGLHALRERAVRARLIEVEQTLTQVFHGVTPIVDVQGMRDGDSLVPHSPSMNGDCA